MKLFTARYIATLCLIIAPAGHGEQFSFDADTLEKIPEIPELDCVIEPSEIVDAGSSVPGLIEAINVDRSDLITAGDILAKLESSVETAALQKARAQAHTNASIKLREETLKLGKITESRNAELLSMSAISKQDMEQLQTESRIAELQVEQEKHNKRVAQLEYQRSRAALDRLTIRSPIDGVITDRFKAVGEYVEDEPVIRIAKLNPLYVEVVVPVDHLGAISAGMKAEVAPSANGLHSYLATVERVDRVADAASGTYGVRLSLENPDYAIPAGLRCKVSFLPATEKQQENIAAISQGDVKNRQDHWVRSDTNKAENDAGKNNIAPTVVAETSSQNPKIEIVKNTVAGPGINALSAAETVTEAATKPSINHSLARQDSARQNSAARKIVDAAVALNGDTAEPMNLLLLASIEKSTQIYIPEKSAETRTPVAPVKMPTELMRALEISPDTGEASETSSVNADTSTVPDQKAAVSNNICYS
ncbi:MAG: efflux RND transporter periplasmic adaptor subunit, partial [Pseudomonadales bacterium]